MNITHLGNGIVAFNDAIDIEKNDIASYLGNLQSKTNPQSYQQLEDDILLSDGGYRYDMSNYKKAPTRYSNLVYPEMNESDREIVEKLESSIYRCLVEYCKLFPSVLETVKWRTRGYVIKYERGQAIGPHCDTNLPYDGDSYVPLNTFPLHNTLTSGIILSDDFDGGDLLFRPWGITAPKKYGTAIIYPSSFAGCHEVTEIVNGIRYAYLSWFGHGTISMLDLDNHSTSIEQEYSWLRGLVNDVGLENLYQKFVPVGTLGVID